MKKLSLILMFTLIYLLNCNEAKSQNGKEAAKYMGEIQKPMNALQDEIWAYMKSFMHGKGARKIEKKRQTLLSELKEAQKNLSKLGSYENDDSYRQAYLNYANLYYIVLNEDYGKIVDMEDIAEQSYDKMEAYVMAKEKAHEKQDDAFSELKNTEKKFAANNDVTLLKGETDKLSLKMKKASEALKYYNQLYLIYFKCNKQEKYVLDALNNKDVNGGQQNINTLATFVKEGMEKLKGVKNFSGVNNLKVVLTQYMKFYKEEAEKGFPEMLDFYIKKDNFDKINKQLNMKTQKDRTKQDIDNYNKAQSEFNKAVNSYNILNNKLNSQRDNFYEQWNKEVGDFFNSNS